MFEEKGYRDLDEERKQVALLYDVVKANMESDRPIWDVRGADQLWKDGIPPSWKQREKK
ncbi:hypothetical protein HK104_006614 [Borealophlyctis nickersoniae]|nr:hypothetical protein HK104_006614 [Borealophlyctis nickersoniae]